MILVGVIIKDRPIKQHINVVFAMTTSFVTRSVKTQHNRASLNFQYKALNTMGEILLYLLKKFRKIFECLFLSEGGG